MGLCRHYQPVEGRPVVQPAAAFYVVLISCFPCGVHGFARANAATALQQPSAVGNMVNSLAG
jgi:hypothetical protein